VTMTGSLRLDAPTALEYFASLVADDASLAVAEAALSIAQDDYPALDCQSVLAEIDGLAARLKSRIASDAAPMQRLRLLNRFFFQELGFAGNVHDYYDARNSYLHFVLQSRRGIPITLAVLYVEIASQIGLHASGVSFPGHFLVKLRMPQGEVVIDPFTGQSM
jgi:regulator of sirC expression with transglutaminase-like and TPR domain